MMSRRKFLAVAAVSAGIAEPLADTARALERAAAKAGAVRTSTLNFVATNGRILVATRWGEAPLYYTRLEGSERCELHGITLAQILEYLVAHYGWPGLDERIHINCFSVNPSVKSSLTFLRRTPWARAKVEEFYRQYLAR